MSKNLINDTRNLNREEEMLEELENLQTANENYQSIIQDLQIELAKSETRYQSIEILVAKVSSQQAEITLLNSALSNEKNQNEKLLELAKSAKTLQTENNQLKQTLQQKNSEIENLKHQVQNLADNFNSAINSFPKVDSIQKLTSALESANEEIKNMHILNFVNYAVVGICLGVVFVTGWQLYSTRQGINTTQLSIESIHKGIYNSKGWSVIEGAENNEWTFSQEHPDDYERWFKQENR